MVTLPWGQLAVPKPRGEDGHLLLALAHSKWPCSHVFEMPQVVQETEDNGDDLICIPIDDKRIDKAVVALSRWDCGMSALSLMDTVLPLVSAGFVGGIGCSSGHLHPAEAGGALGIFATLDDPIGGAGGWMHETMHQRLHIMGIDLERHDGTLLHGYDPERGGPDMTYPEQPGWFYGSHRYFSPIRRDVPRPMTALLHGIYAYIAVLEVEVANDSPQHVSVNVPRVRLGLDTIEKEAQWTERGEAFKAELLKWGHSALDRGEQLLRTAGVDETPVSACEWR